VESDLAVEEALADLMQDLVAEAFETENTRLQEDRDPTALTMSGLGSCTRRNAYAVAGIEPSDVAPPEQARQALLGTGAHAWFLPALARVITARLGLVAEVEKRVALHAAGITIAGQLDLAFDQIVIDLKTVREWKLHSIRRRGGAYSEHQVQVNGYALAEWQAGRNVKWVVYLYMDRTTGDVHPVIERFDNAAAMAVIDRVETITRFAKDNPDAAPREARGPGVSLVCDRCPWLKRCWGPTAVPGETGPQTQLAATPAGLIEILKLALAATGVAGQAHADKEFAKLVLSCTKDGTYGGYKLSHGRDSERDDVEAMRNTLTGLGIEIPKKSQAGSMFVRLAK
jgi:hypothetical protein